MVSTTENGYTDWEEMHWFQIGKTKVKKIWKLFIVSIFQSESFFLLGTMMYIFRFEKEMV